MSEVFTDKGNINREREGDLVEMRLAQKFPTAVRGGKLKVLRNITRGEFKRAFDRSECL